MCLDHTLQYQGQYDGQRHLTLVVRCFHTVARTVVLEIVTHGGHQVVGTVATYRALEAQLVSQSLLLYLAVGSQTDGTTLREAHAERQSLFIGSKVWLSLATFW